MPLYREVTIPMKLHGVRIDTEHFNQVREKIKVKVQDIENHLYSEISHLVAPFEHALLERDYPEKRTGNYPKEVAKLVGLEVTSLAKKAIEKLEVTTLAQINFKDWILGNVDALLLNKVDVQKSLFFSKHSERLHVFNFKSKDHLKHLFFEVLGEKPLSTTEGGEPQVDDAFLASVEADYPWVDLLRDLNVLHKMSGTYIEGILDRTIDGKLYTSFLQFGTTSGRFASRSPNCLSLDTEILTKDGFKNYYSFGPDDYVACYDGANIVWEKPSRKVFVEKSPKQIISVHNQHLNMRMTGDHRVIYRDRRTNLIQECPANRFPKDAHILHGANLVGGEIEVEENLLKFLVAFQADGNYSSTNVLEFKFDKLRKIDRLLGILANLGWSYEYKIVGTGARQRHKVRIHGKTNLVADVLGSGKTFPTSWINLTASCRDTFINELFYWDGSYTRRNNYSSNVEKNVDIAQALLSLSGYRAHKRIYRTSAGNNNYQLDISGRDYSGTSNATITSEISNEEVWCVTVPTGMILARRGSDTFITGNCQNWPAQQKTDTEGMTSKLAAHKKDMDWIVNSIRHGIVANPGYKLIGTDYSSLEPHIAAYVSGDKDLIDIFVQGKDFYSAIAIKQFDLGHLSAFKDDANYLGNVDKARRNLTKTYSLAAFYGATASRISQVLNCPKEEAQELLDGYLEAFPGIKSFIDRSHRDCMYTGKVKTLFGRVRHLSEAKVLYSSYGDQLKDFVWAQKRGLLDERKTYRNLLNNAVNFQIQGAAAHVLNRGMIAMTREFKRLNLDARIVMGVHDETIVEAKEEHVSEVAKVIKECMENAVDINPIKLKATPIVGNSYGDLK
jgi:DNA polymerase I-like protein with 3'-5' exonuclease and polymerase domains